MWGKGNVGLRVFGVGGRRHVIGRPVAVLIFSVDLTLYDSRS